MGNKEKIATYEGFEVWFAARQMQFKMFLILLFMALVMYLPLFVFVFKRWIVDYQTWQDFLAWLKSIFWGVLNPSKKIPVIVCDQNQCIWEYATAIDIYQAWKDYYIGWIAKNIAYLIIGYFMFSVPVLFVFLRFLRRKSRELNQRTIKRGVKIQKPKQLNKQLKRQFKSGKGELPLSDEIRMPRELETRHCFIVGASGTGKTTQLISVIQRLRERGEKAVLFDIKGDYLSLFYQPGDIILNPLDSRCAAWNIFNDVRNYRQAFNFAQSMIPPAIGGVEQYFRDAARNILVAILQELRRKHEKPGNKHVWELISQHPAKLIEYIGEHPFTRTYLSKPDSNQTAGIVSTLMQFCYVFRELACLDCFNGDLSLRKWIQDDGAGFLFLPFSPQHQNLLSPFISSVINILIQEILGMPDDLKRRRFFIVDELGALQKLPSLIEGLTLGRSKGMSFWLGIQDFGKIDQVYGREIRETIWNNCVAKIILRVDAPDTAHFLSSSLGQAEIEEAKKTHGMGVEDNRDGLSITRQEQVKPIFLPAEIQTLPDLTAIIKVGQFDPAYPCQIKIKRLKDISPRIPGFIEREEEDYDIEQDEVKEKEEVKEEKEEENTALPEEELKEELPEEEPAEEDKTEEDGHGTTESEEDRGFSLF